MGENGLGWGFSGLQRVRVGFRVLNQIRLRDIGVDRSGHSFDSVEEEEEEEEQGQRKKK